MNFTPFLHLHNICAAKLLNLHFFLSVPSEIHQQLWRWSYPCHPDRSGLCESFMCSVWKAFGWSMGFGDSREPWMFQASWSPLMENIKTSSNLRSFWALLPYPCQVCRLILPNSKTKRVAEEASGAYFQPLNLVKLFTTKSSRPSVAHRDRDHSNVSAR